VLLIPIVSLTVAGGIYLGLFFLYPQTLQYVYFCVSATIGNLCAALVPDFTRWLPLLEVSVFQWYRLSDLYPLSVVQVSLVFLVEFLLEVLLEVLLEDLAFVPLVLSPVLPSILGEVLPSACVFNTSLVSTVASE